MSGGEIAPCGCMECAPLRAAEQAAAKPTIPLRIRVGVTADGTWLAMTSNAPGRQTDEELNGVIAEGLEETFGTGPVVAWHWITAEVPMPETEQGDVAGTVEHG